MNARQQRTRLWLESASGDLRAARQLMAAQDRVVMSICFHAQQAAEKALKAYLVWMDVVFRPTHDLKVLVQQCSAQHPPFARLATLETLSVYAVETRYPQELPDCLPPDLSAQIAQAADCVDMVLAVLKEAGFTPADPKPGGT